MSRFFDSHAWNTRNRDAAEAVLRAAGLDPLDGRARAPVSAEVADATVRALVHGVVRRPAEPPEQEPGWLVGGARVSTAYRCRI
jgi:hypothetical protein